MTGRTTTDPDLDCTGGPRANPPSPPPYDNNAQAAAPSFNLYPDLTAKEAPANSATGVMAVRHTFSVHGDPVTLRTWQNVSRAHVQWEGNPSLQPSWKWPIGEVRQVKLGLRWDRIQGDIPGRDQADIMFMEAPDGKDDHRKVRKHRGRPAFVVASWILGSTILPK
ncbi:unnamed protein product [Arctogadus glacialis]